MQVVRGFRTVMAGLALVFSPVWAMAASLSLSPIVDSSRQIPGSDENFSGLTWASLRDGKIVFAGSGATNFGIYSTAGGLSVIADQNTPIPGEPGNFMQASNHAFDGADVAFFGFGNGPATAIFSTVGGLHRVADNTTPIPNSPFGLNFVQFENLPQIDDGHVVFKGQDRFGNIGVYVDNGLGLSRVADWQTPAPDDSGNFSAMFFPNIEDGRVGFLSSTSTNWGIFADLGAGLEVTVDEDIPMPGGPGDFAGLGRPHMQNGHIAFMATDITGDHEGVYADFGLGIQTIVDVNTPIPEGVGKFTNFFEISLSGNSVAFWATGSNGQEGIYFARGGVIERVIGIGDTLNGQTVTTLDLYNEGLDGDQLAFSAGFGATALTSSIFVVEVPEPATGLMIVLAAAAVRRRARPGRSADFC